MLVAEWKATLHLCPTTPHTPSHYIKVTCHPMPPWPSLDLDIGDSGKTLTYRCTLVTALTARRMSQSSSVASFWVLQLLTVYVLARASSSCAQWLRADPLPLLRIVSGANRGAANVQEQLTLSWNLCPISISTRVQKRVYSPCSVPGSRLRSVHSPRKRFVVTPAHRQRLPTAVRMPAQLLSQP